MELGTEVVQRADSATNDGWIGFQLHQLAWTVYNVPAWALVLAGAAESRGEEHKATGS